MNSSKKMIKSVAKKQETLASKFLSSKLKSKIVGGGTTRDAVLLSGGHQGETKTSG